jgi:hypothetical protein
MKQWKPVLGFTMYAVSDRGDVFSLHNMRELVPVVRSNGYLHVCLFERGKTPDSGRQVSIHRLVLEAFVGPCPDGMLAAHADGTRTNNRLSNLRWTTQKDNMADAKRHGTAPVGERNQAAKLSDSAVREIRRLCGVASAKALSERFGVCQDIIYRAMHGSTWAHVTDPGPIPPQDLEMKFCEREREREGLVGADWFSMKEAVLAWGCSRQAAMSWLETRIDRGDIEHMRIPHTPGRGGKRLYRFNRRGCPNAADLGD